jgi:hypothetical protein
MLLSDLLGLTVITTAGEELGQVHDALLVQDGTVGRTGSGGTPPTRSRRRDALVRHATRVRAGYRQGPLAAAQPLRARPATGAVERDREPRPRPHRRRRFTHRGRAPIRSLNQIASATAAHRMFRAFQMVAGGNTNPLRDAGKRGSCGVSAACNATFPSPPHLHAGASWHRRANHVRVLRPSGDGDPLICWQQRRPSRGRVSRPSCRLLPRHPAGVTVDDPASS